MCFERIVFFIRRLFGASVSVKFCYHLAGLMTKDGLASIVSTVSRLMNRASCECNPRSVGCIVLLSLFRFLLILTPDALRIIEFYVASFIY